MYVGGRERAPWAAGGGGMTRLRGKKYGDKMRNGVGPRTLASAVLLF